LTSGDEVVYCRRKGFWGRGAGRGELFELVIRRRATMCKTCGCGGKKKKPKKKPKK